MDFFFKIEDPFKDNTNTIDYFINIYFYLVVSSYAIIVHIIYRYNTKIFKRKSNST